MVLSFHPSAIFLFLPGKRVRLGVVETLHVLVKAQDYMKEKGVKVYDTMVGNYMTAIEMAGFSFM